MSDASKAVFLSYASQDAEAAKRICDALRQAGVEVWFDQSELIGGDAWDTKIRKQIKECALFVPIISANTQARAEGYFRLEWRLADKRTELMGKSRAFLLPVCIDGTRDSEADVPDSFNAVQWTRLPDGETPPAFAARVKKLLGSSGMEPGRPRPGERAEGGASPAKHPKDRPWLVPALIGLLAVVALVLWQPWKGRGKAVAAASPAAELVAKARALIDDDPLVVRESYKSAVELCERATQLSPDDGEAWATLARANHRLATEYREDTGKRRAALRSQVERAIRFAPDSIEAGLAMAGYELSFEDNVAAARARLSRLIERAPTDRRLLRMLVSLEEDRGQDVQEARRWAERANALPGGDAGTLLSLAWVHWGRNEFPQVREAVEKSLAIKPMTESCQLRLMLFLQSGDLEGARRFLRELPAAILREDRTALISYEVQLFSGNYEGALLTITAVPREILEEGLFFYARGYLAGNALLLAGKTNAAMVEFGAALQALDERLAETPRDSRVAYQRAMVLARLGETAKAGQQLATARELGRDDWYEPGVCVLLGRIDEALASFARTVDRTQSRWPGHLRYLKYDPVHEPLRRTPRGGEIVAQGDGWLRELLSGGTTSEGAPPAASQAPDKSVAVLAFANLSSDKEQEFFSDGISEEVLNVLAKVPGLKVSARTSAFFFKGKNTPIPEIAKQLGVAYVVEGSVQRAGDRVKITAQLIKAADGFHVWSDSFTRDIKDIFAVQDEIAAKIATSLTDKLGMNLPVSAKTTPEAYTLYLQARSTLAKRGVPNLREAVRMFDRVIAMDPDYLPARSGLAISLALIPAWSRSLALGESLDMINRARREARLVIERQPGNAEAWSALGYILSIYDWRWEEAAEAVARSLALAPNDAEILNFAGDYYRMVLADPLVVETEKRAMELNPLQSVNHTDLSVCYIAVRQYELAIEPGRRGISIAPELVENYEYLLRPLGLLKRFEEMRGVLAEARRVAPENSALLANMEILAAIYESRNAEALQLLEKFRPHVEQGGYSPAEFGSHYLRLGQPEKAVPWLVRGAKGHDISLIDPTIVDLERITADPVTRVVLEEPGLKELKEIRARHAHAAKAR